MGSVAFCSLRLLPSASEKSPVAGELKMASISAWEGCRLLASLSGAFAKPVLKPFSSKLKRK